MQIETADGSIHLPPAPPTPIDLKKDDFMARDQVERRETGFYITGSRVPIDRVIREYRDGEDPETIRSHYPTLTLGQVNGAIAFYESHKEEVEQEMGARRRAEDAYTAGHPNPPDIKQKFERMRRQITSRRT